MEDKTTDYYRTVFCGADGIKVLAHILADTGFFDDTLKTPEEVALCNYGKRILKRLGIIDLQNLEYFAKTFVEAPRIIKTEQEDENI